jgi:hypothetical protein
LAGTSGQEKMENPPLGGLIYSEEKQPNNMKPSTVFSNISNVLMVVGISFSLIFGFMVRSGLQEKGRQELEKKEVLLLQEKLSSQKELIFKFRDSASFTDTGVTLSVSPSQKEITIDNLFRQNESMTEKIDSIIEAQNQSGKESRLGLIISVFAFVFSIFTIPIILKIKLKMDTPDRPTSIFTL